MPLNINVKLKIEEEIKKATNSINNSTKEIATSMKKLADTVEKGMKGANDGVDKMITNINKLGQGNVIQSIVKQYESLQAAQRSNTISADEYTKKMSNLFIELQKVGGQLDSVKSKQQGVGNLSSFGVQTAKAGGFANQGLIQSVDAANLQQIIMLSKEELKQAGLTQEMRRRIADQLEFAQQRMKALNMSSSQLAKEEAKSAANAQKKLIEEQKITAQKEKQAQLDAINARRSNFGSQFSFASGLGEGSIPQVTAKIREMQIARDALNKSDANYQKNLIKVNSEISRLTKEQNKATQAGAGLAGQTEKTNRSLQQMGQIVGTYFSVYAVKNFVTELAKVTGEFDLQRKSLGALLQNKQQADAIFEQIKESALKSPFSVMDLTNYTKQLAAYRIEGDKLFETMTMLADISSGLGVDMGRVILAFGQVKAASVLRGQELRQFTEAGIPLVSLLADKFGELEDRTVSTGEVFDKISNRLVPFQMIDEIFKDMTKSGGMFYEMQKLQSETIKGRIVNLQDAYQLLLDDIGNANSGVIKGFIGLLESVLKNMNGILVVLVPLIAAFATYKGILLTINMAEKVRLMMQQASIINLGKQMVAENLLTKAELKRLVVEGNLNKTLAARMLLNPYVAIAAAVVGLGVAAYKAYQYANKLNKELEEIETKGQAEYNNLVGTFKRLQAIISDTTKSVEEQKAAHEELKRTFKDILPQKLLTIDYLSQEKAGYEQVTAAIYNKIKAQVNEQKLTKIEEEYGEKIVKREESFKKYLMSISGYSEDIVDATIEQLRNSIEKYGLDSNRINDIFQKSFGKDLKIQLGGRGFLDTYAEYLQKIKEVTSQTLNKVSATYTDFGNEFNALGKKLQESLAPDFARVASPKDVADFKSGYDSIVNYYKAKIKQVQEMPNSEQKSLFLIRLEQERNTFISETEQQLNMLTEIANIATEFNLPTSTLMKYNKPKDEGSTEWLDKQKTTIEQRKKQIETYLNTEEKLRDGSIKNIKLFQLETQALEKLAYKYGLREKESGSGSSGESKLIKALKEEIKLIETLQKEYDKLVKAGSGAAEARQKVNTEYAKNIKEVQKSLSKVGINVDFGTLITSDKNVLLELYKSQMEQFKNNAEVQKLLTESFGKLGIEIEVLNLNEIELQLKNEFEKIKNNRAISLELNDAPESVKDILKLLYGISEKDILSEMDKFQQTLNEYIRSGVLKIGAGGGVVEDFTKLTRDEFLKILEPFKDKAEYNKIAKVLIDSFDYIQSEQRKYVTQTGKYFEELLAKYDSHNNKIKEIEKTTQRELENLNKIYYDKRLIYDKRYFDLRDSIIKRGANETSKVMFDMLRDSELYTVLFENLEKAGNTSLTFLYQKLVAFQKGAGKNLPLKEYKELTRTIEKLQDQINKRNPFKTIALSVSGYADAMLEVETATKKVEEAQLIYNTAVVMFGENSEEAKSAAKAVEEATLSLAGAENNAQRNAESLKESISQLNGYIQSSGGTLKETVSFVYELGNAFGFLSDEVTNSSEGIKDLIEKQLSTLEGVGQIIGGFYSNNVGMIIQGFGQALVGTYQSILTIIDTWGKDAKITDGIETTTKAMERQQRVIDRLSDSLDELFADEYVAQSKRIAEEYGNLAANIQKNIDAEKSKKNPDEDLIEDWENDLYDAEKAQKDIIKQMVEEFAGADIKSAAEDFANIWIDSFLAGEDAMANMEARFGDMIKNMIMKTIVSKVIAGRLKAFYTQLESYIDSEEGLTPERILALSQEGMDALKLANTDLKALEDFFAQVGQIVGLGGAGDSQTLQKGISNITEESAQIIAAYLNSLKYEVFRQSGFLEQISINSGITMNMTSDILLESRLTNQILTAMKNWTDSISTNTAGTAGLGIRVYGI